MVTINLFPWRAHLRLYQKRVLKKVVWSAILFITTLNIILYGVLLQREHHARSRLAVIKRELKRYAALQARIDAKTRHTISLSAMKELFADQESNKIFFAGIGANVGNVICFTNIVRDHHAMTFSGVTRSAIDLSQFLHTWGLSALFSDVQIEKLERTNKQDFQFRFQAPFHAL